MTNFCVDKHIITKKILMLIDSEFTEKDLQTAKKTWWYNIRRGGGLGLTTCGRKAFSVAEIEHWDIPIKVSEVVKSAIVLKLDQYFPSPYSIFIKTLTPTASTLLRVYDSRVVSLISLHGNLISYLESLTTKRTELYSTDDY